MNVTVSPLVNTVTVSQDGTTVTVTSPGPQGPAPTLLLPKTVEWTPPGNAATYDTPEGTEFVAVKNSGINTVSIKFPPNPVPGQLFQMVVLNPVTVSTIAVPINLISASQLLSNRKSSLFLYTASGWWWVR